MGKEQGERAQFIFRGFEPSSKRHSEVYRIRGLAFNIRELGI